MPLAEVSEATVASVSVESNAHHTMSPRVALVIGGRFGGVEYTSAIESVHGMAGTLRTIGPASAASVAASGMPPSDGPPPVAPAEALLLDEEPTTAAPPP